MNHPVYFYIGILCEFLLVVCNSKNFRKCHTIITIKQCDNVFVQKIFFSTRTSNVREIIHQHRTMLHPCHTICSIVHVVSNAFIYFFFDYRPPVLKFFLTDYYILRYIWGDRSKNDLIHSLSGLINNLRPEMEQKIVITCLYYSRCFCREKTFLGL